MASLSPPIDDLNCLDHSAIIFENDLIPNAAALAKLSHATDEDVTDALIEFIPDSFLSLCPRDPELHNLANMCFDYINYLKHRLRRNGSKAHFRMRQQDDKDITARRLISAISRIEVRTRLTRALQKNTYDEFVALFWVTLRNHIVYMFNDNHELLRQVHRGVKGQMKSTNVMRGEASPLTVEIPAANTIQHRSVNEDNTPHQSTKRACDAENPRPCKSPRLDLATDETATIAGDRELVGQQPATPTVSEVRRKVEPSASPQPVSLASLVEQLERKMHETAAENQRLQERIAGMERLEVEKTQPGQEKEALEQKCRQLEHVVAQRNEEITRLRQSFEHERAEFEESKARIKAILKD